MQQLVWRWENTEPFGNSLPEDNPSGLGSFEFPLRFPGQYLDKETGLFYNYFRDYDPQTGRYVQSDPIGLAGGINPYLYAEADPLRRRDPTGLYTGVDDAVFAVGGGLIGLLAQAGSDLITGQASAWQDYTGAFVGGAVGGWSLLYTGPAVAGLAAGATTNATKQFLKNISGEQCGYDFQSFVLDTAVGGTIGRFLPGARVPGATTGRGNANAVYRQMVTKLEAGQISSVRLPTAVKMFGGRAIDTSLSPGAALGASYDAGMRRMSSGSACLCNQQ